MADEQWLTIAEAAAEIGVSVDTVRRRLKKGRLDARQVPTERGPAWRIRRSSLQGDAPTVGSNAWQGLGELVALVGKLQEENRTLAGRLGFLEAQLQASQEQVRVLEAARVAPDAPGRDLDAAPSSRTEEPSARPNGSWVAASVGGPQPVGLADAPHAYRRAAVAARPPKD
jgi:excisionase family DNA binding protein